ncbi:MAG: recombinase RecA [Candidatus Altimarinota bacterium]
MANLSEKQQAVELALSQIERSFGKGSIMKMGTSQKMHVETFPTGSLSLDIALGGGIPKGRIVEVYGPESSGKTTLTLHMISEIQKAGGIAAFIDAEHALDPEYAKRIGVDLENLLVSQPDSGEQALEIAETLVRSNAVDIIVVDSVAALTPKAEIEGDMGDSHMGLQARLMSQALRKLTAAISKSKATVIFINQLRMKIGVMFGNPETTTGGNALKFYASVRLEIRSAGKLEEGTGDDKQYTGNRVKVKIVKNKVAPPFKTAEFDIMYNKGISRLGDLIDLGVKYEVIKKAGAFYSYGENKIGQGRENTRAFLTLKENEKIAKSIEKDVLEVVKKIKDEDNGSVAELPAAPARPISKSAKAQAPVQE